MMRKFFWQGRQLSASLCRTPLRCYSSIQDKEQLLKSLQTQREKMQQVTQSLEKSLPPTSSKQTLAQNLFSNLQTLKKENATLTEKIVQNDIAKSTISMSEMLAPKVESVKERVEPPKERVVEKVVYREQPRVVEKVIYTAPQTVVYQPAPQAFHEPSSTTININRENPPRHEPVQQYYAAPQPAYSSPPPPPPPSSMPEIRIVDDEPSPWGAIIIGGVVVIVAAGCLYYMWSMRASRKKEKKEAAQQKQEAVQQSKMAEENHEKELDEEIARLQREIAVEEAKQRELLKRIKN